MSNRKYADFIEGTTTTNPLLIGGTTLASAVFEFIPEIVAGDTLRLVLDPERVAGEPEIVIVTAHTAAATSVTVTRAADGTTAREHASGTKVVLSLVTSDLVHADTVVGCKVYRTTGQSITAGTDNAIDWTAERFDTHAFHDNSTNPSRITIPAGLGGKYEVTFFMVMPGDVTDTDVGVVRIVGIRDDAASFLIGGYFPAQKNNIGVVSGIVTTVLDLAAGDWIDAIVQYGSGTSGTAPAIQDNDIYGFFQAIRIGN